MNPMRQFISLCLQIFNITRCFLGLCVYVVVVVLALIMNTTLKTFCKLNIPLLIHPQNMNQLLLHQSQYINSHSTVQVCFLFTAWHIHTYTQENVLVIFLKLQLLLLSLQLLVATSMYCQVDLFNTLHSPQWF